MSGGSGFVSEIIWWGWGGEKPLPRTAPGVVVASAASLMIFAGSVFFSEGGGVGFVMTSPGLAMTTEGLESILPAAAADADACTPRPPLPSVGRFGLASVGAGCDAE